MRPDRISIAATDGSQIFPDRHEVSPCFLINIGYVLLHYGSDEHPLLNSRPWLYYRDEDLFVTRGGRRVRVDRELVGIRRDLMELTELADLSCAAQDEGCSPLALIDGSLIMWGLEGRSSDHRGECLETMLAAYDQLRRRGIPIAGYTSRPGGQDLLNALRVGLCPLDLADCDRCPQARGVAAESSPPCSALDGIGDAALFGRFLKPGQRSSIFASTLPTMGEYGDHGICFFYVHVGEEIARVEVPRWVAENVDLLTLVHSCVCDQAAKGRGYPVCLAEAHERAVVGGADRELFYLDLRDELVRGDLRARVSPKNEQKRHSRV